MNTKSNKFNTTSFIISILTYHVIIISIYFGIRTNKDTNLHGIITILDLLSIGLFLYYLQSNTKLKTFITLLISLTILWVIFNAGFIFTIGFNPILKVFLLGCILPISTLYLIGAYNISNKLTQSKIK